MPRAMALFKKEGLDPIPAPTDYLARGEGKWYSLPHPSTMANTRSAFHEYIGYLWSKIRGQI